MTNPIQAIIWQELGTVPCSMPHMHNFIRMSSRLWAWPIPWPIVATW